MSAATKWLELAKIERQRARARDGTSEKLKQNTPGYFKMGGRGRAMIDTTKEIIDMARQGKDAEQIIKRMSFKGMNRKRVIEVMYRYKSRIEAADE